VVDLEDDLDRDFPGGLHHGADVLLAVGVLSRAQLAHVQHHVHLLHAVLQEQPGLRRLDLGAVRTGGEAHGRPHEDVRRVREQALEVRDPAGQDVHGDEAVLLRALHQGEDLRRAVGGLDRADVDELRNVPGGQGHSDRLLVSGADQAPAR
jgi:hypothetical protein